MTRTGKRCARCGETKPLPAFALDKSRPDGRAYTCKVCKAAEQRARQRGEPPPRAVTGLVLVLPERPPPPVEPQDAPPVVHGHYRAAVERFLAALDPPHGDSDAILVHSLRHMSEMADRVVDITDSRNLIATCTQLQRELLGTRAAKGKATPAAAPAPAKSKMTSFRDAL